MRRCVEEVGVIDDACGLDLSHVTLCWSSTMFWSLSVDPSDDDDS